MTPEQTQMVDSSSFGSRFSTVGLGHYSLYIGLKSESSLQVRNTCARKWDTCMEEAKGVDVNFHTKRPRSGVDSAQWDISPCTLV